METSTRRASLAWACRIAAAAALACGTAAMAQGYPTKPVKIIVPFPAGGTTDLVARLIAPALGDNLGQPVLIENRGGAGGLLGADAVAKAPADGHTLLLTNVSYPLSVLSAQRAKRLPFDAGADLAPVSIVANVPMILTAPPTVPAKDLREFATLLRSNPSLQYAYGSTGPGSFLHVLGETFVRDAKLTLVHVPFKGAAPMKQEMLAGRIQLGGDQLSTSLAEVRAGTLRALATTAGQRAALLPDVPTVRELGFTVLESDGWNGIMAPGKTPPAVLAQLQRAIAAAVQQPDVLRRLQELGAEPLGSSAADMDALVRRQMAQFKPVIDTLPLE